MLLNGPDGVTTSFPAGVDVVLQFPFDLVPKVPGRTVRI